MMTTKELESKLHEISVLKKKCKSRTVSDVEYLLLLERLETAYLAEYEKAQKRPKPMIMDDPVAYWTKFGKEYV